MELRCQALPEHGELNRGEMKRHGPGHSANEGHSFDYSMQCFKTSLPFFKHASLSVCPSPCGWQSSLSDCHSFLFPTPSSSHYQYSAGSGESLRNFVTRESQYNSSGPLPLQVVAEESGSESPRTWPWMPLASAGPASSTCERCVIVKRTIETALRESGNTLSAEASLYI